jgi:hypothetical protein
MHHYGMTAPKLNPSHRMPGRLTPIACDFKRGFDRGDTRVGLPPIYNRQALVSVAQ